jgi:hypothetical protein
MLLCLNGKFFFPLLWWSFITGWRHSAVICLKIGGSCVEVTDVTVGMGRPYDSCLWIHPTQPWSLYIYPVLLSSNTHVIRHPSPPPFVCPLDLPARLTRNSCYTAGFPDGHYTTSRHLTLIRKTNMICRLCVFNCSLRPTKIKRPGIFISAAPEVTSRTVAIIIRVFRSFPIFAQLWRFSVFNSLQSCTPRIC